EITPEEVRTFFYDIPEDERPIFGDELEIAQIVIDPEVPESEIKKVIDRLKELRRDIVENGESFATKAVLYSQDASRKQGGKIDGIKRNGPYAKEFVDMAFTLRQGEVSEPFETQFGYHLLYVEKVRGQEVDVRHIILIPNVTEKTVAAAKSKIDSLRIKIINKEITFADAARKYSDEKETRNNGGQLINPVTFDTRFDLTKLDPVLNAQIYNLKNNEVSPVIPDKNNIGKMRFKMLTVTNRYDEHKAEYSKDYLKIKELALKEKQKKAIEAWQTKKIKETYISVNRDYSDCKFESNWLKN
ncbi:MAG: peptidylprolyl isomerase, partial [Flavobacteriaceae bacterium]|nr:peptidylprolyl isomerase [Flavobacteriaceae bacterium]